MSRPHAKFVDINRQKLHFLDNYLNVVFLSVGKYGEKYYKLELFCVTSFIIASSSMSLGFIVGIVNRADISSQIAITLNLNVIIIFIETFWLIRLNGETFRKFRTFLFDTRYHEAALITKKRFKRKLFAIVRLFALTMSTIILGTLFLPVILTKKLDFTNKNLYTMPYWFACTDDDDISRNNFPIEWLCIRIDKLWKFASINLFVNSFYLWGAFIYLGIINFSFLIVTYLNSHVRVINDRIEKMADSSSEERQQIGELVQIIKHHQFIQTIVRELTPFLAKVSIALSTSCFTVLVLAIMMIVNEKNSTGSLAFRLRMATGVLYTFVVFLIFCSSVEDILHVNERVSTALYNSSWYRRPIRFRKLMILFLIRLQAPFRVRILGTFTMGLELLMSFIRKLYATLNIALSLYPNMQS